MVDVLAGERASVKWGLVGGAVRTRLYLLQSEFRMSLVERSSSKYIQGLLNIPGRKKARKSPAVISFLHSFESKLQGFASPVP